MTFFSSEHKNNIKQNDSLSHNLFSLYAKEEESEWWLRLSVPKLLSNISFCVTQMKEVHACLEQHEGE